MFEKVSRRSSSVVDTGISSSQLMLGTDLNRDPVYLSGTVVPSLAFAEAMLTLGKVVKIRKPEPKDHSAYQEWVAKEYLRLLQIKMPLFFKEAQSLLLQVDKLRGQMDRILEPVQPVLQVAEKRKQAYFKWLFLHDRQTWFILDPIVSVQKDGTFFEAFSGDESMYARVFLPHSQVVSSDEPALGTTNIDFSLLMEREFDRVRSYRPMNLTVGLKSVDFTTEAAVVKEEKIPLPESWVRGLVEVQSVLSLSPTEFEISADALAEVIAKLKSQREKTGPRSLKFILEPGRPIRIEIEPWGHVFVDDWFTYNGNKTTEIRIWGRRRLLVLEDLLRKTDKVKVRLLGSGMPSFWTVVREEVELTIGLSGWSSNDWSSKARFSALIPVDDTEPEKIEQVLDLIKKEGVATTKQVSELTGIPVQSAASILQKLCLQGKTMFDAERGTYRWRDLFPTLDLYEDSESSREMVAGRALVLEGKVAQNMDETKGDIRYLGASVADANGTYLPILELDLDYRPRFAQCNCPFYNYNKLKQGPCRHLIALSLSGGA